MSEQATRPEFSIIIPAFNESLRIIPTLEKTSKYFSARNSSFEIIVVNDGSTDATQSVVKEFIRKQPEVSIISFDKNTGKGAAVRTGMLEAKGTYLLFQDADGATPIEEFDKLFNAISTADIAIGSRALYSDDTKVITNLHRKLLGRIFNFLANICAAPGILDTQCGFKLFKAESAKKIFPLQRLNGFSFDVEVLYIAGQLGYKVNEVAINWINVPGTKVNVFKDGLKMFADIILIKFLHRNQ